MSWLSVSSVEVSMIGERRRPTHLVHFITPYSLQPRIRHEMEFRVGTDERLEFISYETNRTLDLPRVPARGLGFKEPPSSRLLPPRTSAPPSSGPSCASF